jgi:SAM-dependent methyltransferase
MTNVQNKKLPSAPFCRACHQPVDRADSRGHKDGYELLSCKSCGTVTADPFPTAEELTAFYQAYRGSKMYKPKEKKKILRAERRIKRLLSLTKGRRLLDVGCNMGYAVKAGLNLNLDARGIDIDPDTLDKARASYGDRFTCVSVQDYAAQGQKADIIHTSEVIEHVPDPDSFTAALHKILNDDGVLYLTTPDSGHWGVPRDFMSWDAVKPPFHITYFTRKGIRAILERHGFEVIKFSFSLKPGLRVTARKVRS